MGYKPSSSWDVLLRQAAVVAFSECLIHDLNITVNQPPHVRGEGVKGGPASAGAFEMPVLVGFGTEEAFLAGADVEKDDNRAEPGHQRLLQLFIMKHQQLLAKSEPVQNVRRPPGRVTADKLGPFCIDTEIAQISV